MFLSNTLKQYEKPVLFGIVILIAITFGISSQAVFLSDRRDTDPAVKLFGETLTLQQWREFTGRWRVLYGFLYSSDRITEEIIEHIAKDDIATLHEAKAAGIQVSNGEVARFIQMMFQRGPGEFNADNYLESMRSRRIRVDEFEASVADFLRIKKFMGLAQNSASVSLKAVFDDYVKQNEEARADVVVFAGRDFARKVTDVSGAEIARTFAADPKRYQVPDRVQIAYVMAAQTAMEAEVKDPGDEELKKVYEAHKSRWAIPETAGPDKGGEPAKDQIKKDEPPKDQVKKDESKKDSDKDGEKDPKEAPPAKDDAKYKPFEQVRAEVLKEYTTDRAGEICIEKIDELERAVNEASLRMDNQAVDLEALAKKMGLTYNVTGYFSQATVHQIAETLGYSPQFMQLVFTMEEGETSQPVPTEKGRFIYRVLRKKPAEPGRLTEDVRQAVLRGIRAKKGEELAKNEADAFHAAVKAKYDARLKQAIPAEMTNPDEIARKQHELAHAAFVEVAAERKQEIKKTDWFRRDGYIAGLKTSSRELAGDAMEVGVGVPGVSRSYQDAYVFLVDAKRPPDSAGFATQRDFLRERLIESTHQKFLRGWLDAVQVNAHFEDLRVKPKPAPSDEAAPGEAPKNAAQGPPPDHGDDDN